MQKVIIKIIKFINKKLFWLIYRFKPIFMFPFPNFVCIETSTHCNLKCICCPTGQEKEGMSKGFLKFDDFKKFVDKYIYFIDRIYFTNYGEIFLNPEIFKIIKYATDRDIETNADSNLNYFNEEMAEKLVESGMARLTVSIDGATNESYAKYRIGGNFNSVISNIISINKLKKKYKSEKPNLTWQFILFGHNVHEIGKARNMAKELDMEFSLRANWDPDFSPVRNIDYKISLTHYSNQCYQLWHMPVINYNGNLLGCCSLFYERYHFGNVFKNGFFSAFNSRRMRMAREIILNKVKKTHHINSIYCIECKWRKHPAVHLGILKIPPQNHFANQKY